MLRTDEGRRVRVDSWDVCGDNTPRHVSVDDRLVVTGEYERGEFDAFSIENSYQEKICD